MNSLQQSLFTALQACHAALQNLHVRQHWDKHIEDLLGDDMYDEAVDAENLAAAALADSRLRTEADINRILTAALRKAYKLCPKPRVKKDPA